MLEPLILSNLIYNEEYARKVIPFLKESYFPDPSHSWTFKIVSEFINTYNRCPTLEALAINLQQRTDINQTEFNSVVEFISSNIKRSEQELDWLVDATEKYCQDKAIYNAIYESLDILNDEEKKPRTAIPDILQDALGVSFTTNIGLNFIDDAETQFEFMHAVHKKISLGLVILDKIFKGGVHGKTFNVFMGGIGFGKTQFMCNFAGHNLKEGKDVLYITLEMSENEIKKRIDANLFDVSLDDINMLSREKYMEKHEKFKEQYPGGRLIIKEYAEGTVGAAHFRNLLHELKIKRRFVPDIVYIDYVNLCASTRVRIANVGLYEYIKMVCQEIRGLAKEMDIPIVSATQVNRAGFRSSDPGMDDTSESFGLPATCDFLGVIIQSDELHRLGQVMIKQLKNRYSDYLKDNRFVIGVQRDKMRLYDVEQQAQERVLDTPVFDSSETQTRFNRERFAGVQ